MPEFSSPAPKMADVFKTHPNPEVLQNLLTEYRARAVDILQNTIPEKIVHIQTLLKGENDPSSILWIGRVEKPGYKEPKVMQPSPEVVAEFEKLHLNGEGAIAEDRTGRGKRQIVLPEDIVDRRAQVVRGDDADEIMDLKAGLRWFEILETNKVQAECVTMIIKELQDMRLLSQDLRLWLQLEIPVIEDGNGFGAEVQNNLINQVVAATKMCDTIQDVVRSHYTDRLRLATAWTKYPNFMDHQAALACSDQMDHFYVRSHLRAILTSYGGLLSKFEKNWTKVINPKGNRYIGGMY